MTALNTTPFYASSPDTQFTNTDGNAGAAGALKTQNTATDGTGTVLTVWTADATYGSAILALRIYAAGTNIQTVLRIFGNNGSTNATVGNNYPIDEMTLPLTTAQTAQAIQPYWWIPPMGVLRLKPNHKLNVTLGTTVAAGYFVTAFGGVLGP